MAEAQKAEISGMASGVAMLRGRIDSVRRHEGRTYTRLVLPAESEFDQPSTVEVRSNASFGQGGEMATVRVKIGGYRKKAYTFTDKSTGEQRTVVPVVVTLDSME